MRRPIVLSLALLAFLGGCGTSARSTYTLQFDTSEPSELTVLSLAVTRVVERRLAAMGEDAKGIDISQKDTGPQLSFRVETEAAADILREDLTLPFKLRILRAARDKEPPAIEVEGHGGFVETGVTEGHLEWVEATEEPDNKGRITLQFTEDGRTLMRKVFRENVGKNIGLFVRDRLVAQLQVDTAELKDDIIITGIPSAELARIFADDVNVGLHVTFVSVP